MPGNLLSHTFEYHVKCFEIIKHSELAKKDEWLLFVATKCYVEIFILRKPNNFYELEKTGLKVNVCVDEIFIFKNRVFIHNTQSKRLEELIISYTSNSWVYKVLVGTDSLSDHYQIKR